jgi:Zn-dependent protease with chaperone function
VKAKYFDGKSSKSHLVEVKKQMDGLKIDCVDNEGGINRYWKLEEITSENFSSSKKVLLSYGDFPHERLELNGEEAFKFLDLIGDHETKVKSLYHFITKAEPVKLVLGSSIILILVLYSYIFHLSPLVGEHAVKILPISLEITAGELMYDNMDYMIDKDPVKSSLLEEFFVECGFTSDYDIRIDYANDDMVNAFAVPGGQIVVFDGLIKSTESWDELAALLAHELAHVNQRHSFKQIARSMSSYFLISVLTGDVAGASSVVLENAAQVYELSNSRAHETEADVVGLQYLKESKIRPNAMYNLFERLKGETPEIETDVDIEKSLEYFQTHPATSNRMENITEIIDSDISYQYTPKTCNRAKAIWMLLKDQSFDLSGETLIDKINDRLETVLGDDENAHYLDQ